MTPVKKKKKKRGRKPSWWKREEIQDYIIDCYEGVDTVETVHGPAPYRAFMWAEGREVYIGNSTAFAEHLEKKFRIRNMSEWAFYQINQLLLDLGERIHDKKSRRRTGKHPGSMIPEPRKERVK